MVIWQLPANEIIESQPFFNVYKILTQMIFLFKNHDK